MQAVELEIFFNFRSPYCYLASKTMFGLLDAYHARLAWRPLGGWHGRSPPERAKKKVPLARQDVGRFARRLGIPFNPPPPETDPTRAGAASLYAEEAGCLRAYVIETMRAAWGEGRDIGRDEVLRDIAARAGMDADVLLAAADDPERRQRLEEHWARAEQRGVFGVPTFVVGDQLFWGQDRIEFVADHLRELRLARL
ncbi:2-hydroxychromene-2-carboxylate isomerase [Aerosticca soli]|jgi:2-hydroxychromene-2-carboxylate isomerase|uniref:2-hydroxychromene-2-carboxylate isomerase n=1 Tax=Aerosticca soli TaxID=2010829 RepID=A0A2Z6E4W0_9GAMM|nr:2-hydroxychromene-2-carboxylate isomerase [Aerosticca soli]MDI3261998.1 2-hydroxychromene-2-carboxylate isomerase [Fulvimonas sp.]BBD79539.1 2-hydroxychromene-2-carboxylate isomerase [Aerosticca soli]